MRLIWRCFPSCDWRTQRWQWTLKWWSPVRSSCTTTEVRFYIFNKKDFKGIFFITEDHISSCPRPFLIIVHPAIFKLRVPDSESDVIKKNTWIPRSTKSAAPWPVALHCYANPVIHTCRKPNSESTLVRSKIPVPSFFLLCPVVCHGISLMQSLSLFGVSLSLGYF